MSTKTPPVDGTIKHRVAPLVLYMRRGCHLCEDMHQLLLELVPADDYTLKLVDIDADQMLKERFDTLVPVLECAGEPVCHYFLDLKAVSTALAGYNKG